MSREPLVARHRRPPPLSPIPSKNGLLQHNPPKAVHGDLTLIIPWACRRRSPIYRVFLAICYKSRRFIPIEPWGNLGLPRRRSLYSAWVTQLKNNRLVAGVLVVGFVASTAAGIVGNIEKIWAPFLPKSHQLQEPAPAPIPNLEFVRLKLAADANEWREVGRNEPNYRYLLAQRMSDTDPAQLAKLEAEKKAGKYSCPGEFARDEWCKEAARLFSQKEWREAAVDPVFDVLVKNQGDRPLVFQLIGVEILGAAQELISGGDLQTGTIKTSGTYTVEMPEPVTILVDGAEVPVDDKGGYSDYEWGALPKMVTADIEDPVRIAPGDAYRFNLVLRQYSRLPNNVLLRFALGVEKNVFKSEAFYLLAMP